MCVSAYAHLCVYVNVQIYIDIRALFVRYIEKGKGESERQTLSRDRTRASDSDGNRQRHKYRPRTSQRHPTCSHRHNHSRRHNHSQNPNSRHRRYLRRRHQQRASNPSSNQIQTLPQPQMHALPLIRLPFRRFIITVFDRGWTKCSLGMHHVCLIPRARLNRFCSRKAVGGALLSIYLPVCVSAYEHACIHTCVNAHRHTCIIHEIHGPQTTTVTATAAATDTETET